MRGTGSNGDMALVWPTQREFSSKYKLYFLMEDIIFYSGISLQWATLVYCYILIDNFVCFVNSDIHISAAATPWI